MGVATGRNRGEKSPIPPNPNTNTAAPTGSRNLNGGRSDATGFGGIDLILPIEGISVNIAESIAKNIDESIGDGGSSLIGSGGGGGGVMASSKACTNSLMVR